MQNPRIIRNRLKLEGVVKNARAYWQYKMSSTASTASSGALVTPRR